VRKVLFGLRQTLRLWNIPEWAPRRVQERFPELRVVALPDYTHIDQEIEDAEIYIGIFLRPEQLRRARNLKWMHATAAGVNHLCYPEMVASPVVLTNSSSVMALAVAEHTMALILALAKRIPSAVRYQDRAQWGQEEIYYEGAPLASLHRATLGLVGLGSIGRLVAARARAFEMRVVAVKRDATTGQDLADRVLPPSALREMLAEADFVALVAPSTPETQGLIGAAELAAMKPTAYLVNVARGNMVDEAALLAALKRRQIAGAALDVAQVEPLAAESALWRAPNLLFTPHLAASTGGLWERHVELIEQNLRRYLNGQPLLHVVDKARGY
jgi:phosphoglycerate dehydrogenase-like enzyme